ncbi:hypothetical protein ACVLD2_001006 [Paenibacillus sp. PvR052]|nr:hypothetical protein [Paenibacillus sp. PvP091]MBP1169528.1 hypothetical protein [Paenibacillus sp. PvR098]MBP2440556.1 hypothetical protein [Paenibacillus sp. PvP052]
MNALIAHHDELARIVFTHYCKQSNIIDCYEVEERNEVYKKVQEKKFDVLIINIDWIFNVSSLNAWLSYNRVLRHTKILAVTTDFCLDHEKWCENQCIFYRALPLTYRVFNKVLIESNT